MMKHISQRSVFLFSCLLFLLGISSTLQAATLEFTVSTLKTGGIKGALNTVGDDLCPTNPTAGCDFDDTDNIVRTNDDIKYQFNVNVGPAGDNVIIASSLKAGMVWSQIPTICNIATSTIGGNGTTVNPSILTCDIGYRASFASSFSVNAKVLGNNPNGTAVGMLSAKFNGTNSTAIDALLPNDNIVTASPRLNLRKSYLTSRTEIVDGSAAYMVWYTYWLELWKHDTNGNPADNPEPLLGNEMVQGPITFTEDLSNVSPNAYINNCYVSYGTSGGYPYNVTNATYPERSVTNAGTASCNKGPTATGGQTLTVTGADLSFSHIPTRNWRGGLLPSDRKIAAYGTINVVIPAADFAAAGGSVVSANTLTNFDPTSISGISNFLANSEDVSDNTVTRAFTPSTTSSWYKSYRHSMTGEQDPGKRWWDAPTTATSVFSGNGLVLPGQTWSTLLAYYNRGFTPDTGVSMCDVIDDRYFEIVDRISGDAVYVYGTPARAPDGSAGIRGVDYIIEYGIDYVGTWPPASYPASASIKTECSDASVQWFSTTTAARAAGRLTKVRYRNLTGLPPSYGGVVIKHRAKNSVDLASIPSGTLLSSMATVKNDKTWPTWRDCNYNLGAWPTPSHSHNYCGDRLSLARATARIEKTTVPNDLVDDVIVGGTVRYKLAPSFTSISTTQDAVVVRDNLPIGTVYVAGSGVSNGVAFPPVITGTPATGQVLTWDLGNRQTNDPIDPIEFTLSIPINTAAGTIFDNVAIIESNSDGSSEALRSDTRSISVSAPALLVMGQSTITPLVNQGEDFSYTVEYHNEASTAIGHSDIIDILPYNGDARTPPSNFTGSYSIAPLTFSSSHGTAYYSKANPSTINIDPLDGSNDFATGSTKWCLASTIGGSPDCPLNYAEVTAVRFVDTESLVAGEDRTFTITFTPMGNAEDDIYTNLSRGYGEGVALRPLSPHVAVRIRNNPIDFGDAPNYISASHGINAVSLGEIADDDTGNYGGNNIDENGNASDDDTEGDTPDDEDGVGSFSDLYDTANSYSVDITAKNGINTFADANLVAWIDFDKNGVFDADEATSISVASTLVSVPSTPPTFTVNSVTKTLTWSNLGTTGADIVTGTTYARFRISTDPSLTINTPGGFISDGEVEDYQITILASGNISGSVKDPDGNTVVGAQVKLIDPSTATTVVINGSTQIVYPAVVGTDGNDILPITVDPMTGIYSFSNVSVGDYKVIEINPANYTSTNETSDQTGDPANISITDDEIPVTITAGETDADNNFIDVLDIKTLALEKVATLELGPDGILNVGDVINYAFKVTNTGNVTLTNVLVTDLKATVTGTAITTLLPNAEDTSTFTASYSLTQADIDAGFYENSADVTAKDSSNNDISDKSDDPSDTSNVDSNGNGNPDDPTKVSFNRIGKIALEKEGTLDLGADGVATIGDTINYTFKVTNTGNTTLSNVLVADPLVNLQGTSISSLAPGVSNSTSFTASYSITQTDIDASYFENTATVTAKDPSNNDISDTSDDPQDPTDTDITGNGNPDDPTMTLVTQAPNLMLVKAIPSNADEDNSNSITLGDTLTYTIIATNVGNQTLTTVIISDLLITPTDKTCTSVLIQETCVLTGTYVVTADDAAAGQRINTASVDSDQTTQKTATVTVTVEMIIEKPPVAVDDEKLDQPLAQPVTIATVSNDTDPEDNLDPKTVMLFDASDNPVTTLTVTDEGVWTVDASSGDITFTPEQGFVNDPKPVQYTVKDTTDLESNKATIIIDYETPASLSGIVWLDKNKNGVIDNNEDRKAGWTLKVRDKNRVIVATTVTNSVGEYTIIDLIPAEYDVEFYTPNGVYVGKQATLGPLESGKITSLLLPIDPSGIVYDSSTRQPLANVKLQFVNAQGAVIDDACLGVGQQNQLTLADGLYAFDLTPTAHSSCPHNMTYTIKILTPPTGYYADSIFIPVSNGVYDGDANETNCTVDAVANSGSCEVQAQPSQPQTNQPTTYFMNFLLNMGDKNIIFNHIPLDSDQIRNTGLDDNAILLKKSVNKKQASLADQVFYTIEAENTTNGALNIDIQDNLPMGFKFVNNQASLLKTGADGVFGTVDDIKTAIIVTGRGPIRFAVSLNSAEKVKISYLLKLGTSTPKGIAINKAQAYAAGSTADIASNLATAKLIVIADGALDQSTLIGKVFHDRDADGYQDDANVSNIIIRNGQWKKSLGNLKGRVSVLDDPAKNSKVIFVPDNSQTSQIRITSDEGSVISINARSGIIESHKGLKASGLTAQDIKVRIKRIENGREITLTNYGIHEEGILGVRIATPKGILIETDSYGRYHLPDSDGGRPSSGKNIILKVDKSTLPEGAKLTTENPRVLRISSSALNKINFGVKLPLQVEPPKYQFNQARQYRTDIHKKLTTRQVPVYQTVEVKLGSIFFDTDQHNIRADQRGVMADIGINIERYGSGHITIDAYTDSRHTAKYNIELAQKRAATVRNALQKRLGEKLMKKVKVVIDENTYKEVPHNDKRAIDYKAMGFF